MALAGPGMLIGQTLRHLSGDLRWAVVFDVAAIADVVGADAFARAVGMPATVTRRADHVALTSDGPCLLTGADSSLTEPRWSLSDAYADMLAELDTSVAHCLAVGRQAPWPPVAMGVHLDGSLGTAVAMFQRRPTAADLRHLSAVGVTYRGGSEVGTWFRAAFTIDLAAHFAAAIRAGFQRTGNCNQFFLEHGTLSPNTRLGLRLAGMQTVAAGRDLAGQALLRVVSTAPETYAMKRRPPMLGRASRYGDNITLAAVSGAARRLSGPLADDGQAIARTLSNLLQQRSRHGLWAFHHGGLPTAIDSALVLTGLGGARPSDQERFAAFRTDEGAYLPQLSGDGTFAMPTDDGNRHWCQPDFVTTCLIATFGASSPDAAAWAGKRFATRSGLFVANPYLVDWAFARLLAAADTDTGQRLAAEVLATQHRDGAFGTYDVALSTAAAILTLDALGVRGEAVRAAQTRLTSLMTQSGTFPPTTPFYSAMCLKPEQLTPAIAARIALGERRWQVARIGQDHYGVTFYSDSLGLLTSAIAVHALSVHCRRPMATDHPVDTLHARYRCRTHLDYVARFALPPYTGGRTADNLI